MKDSDLVGLLEKGLNGSFLSEDDLTEREHEICMELDWINRVVKGKCEHCGGWHTQKMSDDYFQCPVKVVEYEAERSERGFKFDSDMSSVVGLGEMHGYEVVLAEAVDVVNVRSYDGAVAIFTPNIEQVSEDVLNLFVPLSDLPSFVEGGYSSL